MKIYGLNVYIIAIAFILVLGLMMGARFIISKNRVDRPLAKALSRMDGVAKYEIGHQGRELRVRVTLQDVDNLMQTYLDAMSKARSAVGENIRAIEIVDRRTRELEQAYYEAQFSIQEAITTGNFSEMADRVKTVASKSGLDRYGLFVDENYVYVQFHKKGHYLYEVVPRIGFRGDASSNAGNGGGEIAWLRR